MRLCTYREYEYASAGVMVNGRVVALEDLNDAWGQDFGPDLGALIRRGRAGELAHLITNAPRKVYSGWRPESLKYLAPYRDPQKILGIGLNFQSHAAALGEKTPEEPASFFRPATCIGDPVAPLRIPPGVGRVTAEAEIGVVMGKRLKDAASAEEARDAVLGFAPVLDLTAEEVLRRNPRYLTRAKSYDGFLVFGPWIVTRDEWEPAPATMVRTTQNGKVSASGPVHDMTFTPYELVAFHSRVFAWEPGDVLLTGTPGAVALASGDRVGCAVDGLPPLECTVA